MRHCRSYDYLSNNSPSPRLWFRIRFTLFTVQPRTRYWRDIERCNIFSLVFFFFFLTSKIFFLTVTITIRISSKISERSKFIELASRAAGCQMKLLWTVNFVFARFLRFLLSMLFYLPTIKFELRRTLIRQIVLIFSFNCWVIQIIWIYISCRAVTLNYWATAP